MDFARLFRELRQRKTVQTVIVYVGGSWGLLQALSLFQQTYGWPRAVMDVSLYLLACGLFAAVTLSWYHGEKGHQRVQRTELLILTLIAAVGAVGAGLLTRPAQAGKATDAELGTGGSDSTVAVLPFVNRTGDSTLVWLQGGLAEMLTTDLAQAPQLHLVSGQRVYDLLRQQRALQTVFVPESAALAVAKGAGAGALVRGFVYRDAGNLVVDAELVRASDEHVLASGRVVGRDVFKLVDTVALKLEAGLPAAAAPAARAPLADVATANLDAYREYSQGVTAERERRQAEAASHYARALALDSTFPQALIRLGMAEFRAGQDSAAAANLRRAEANLVQGPARQRDFVQGVLALLQGDRVAAEQKLQLLTHRYPEERDAWVGLARAYEGAPERAAARAGVLRQLLRLDPYYAPAWSELALLYARQGDHRRADSLSARGAALAPREAEPLDTRGQVLELAGRYDQARAAYLAALRLRPDFVDALPHLARAAERAGRIAEARADLAPFTHADSAVVRVAALLALAELDLWQGRARPALAGQQRALEAAAGVDPPTRDAVLLALSETWSLLGQPGRAADALRPRALAARDALLPYAAALGEAGRLRELEQLRARVAARATAAERRRTGGADSTTLDAYLAFYRRDWAGAERRFQAVRTRRGGAVIDAREVVALLENGRPADALALLEGGGDPLDLAALREHRRLYLRGRALEAVGRTAEAAAAYRAIVRDWGEALAGFPEFRDVPQRLARLAG